MHVFVETIFWMGVASFVLRAITMGVSDWPKTERTSLGTYVGATLLGVAVTFWAAAVLWLH